MHLNPYGSDAVLLAVGLANDPPSTVAELDARCRSNGVVVELRTRSADLQTVNAVLDEWRAVVDAPDAQTRAARMNAMLASYSEHPRLSDHAGDGWHVHYRPDHVSTGRLVATLISTGTALHLAGRGINRLGRCDADRCDRIYADLSRTGRQRYCSPACANRDAVRRHRSRASR
jgi:hypothetical protein